MSASSTEPTRDRARRIAHGVLVAAVLGASLAGDAGARSAPQAGAADAAESVVRADGPEQPVRLADWFDVVVRWPEGGLEAGVDAVAGDPADADAAVGANAAGVTTPAGSSEIELDPSTLPAGVVAGRAAFEHVDGDVVVHQPLRALLEGELVLEGLVFGTPAGDVAVPAVRVDVVLGLPDGRDPEVADLLDPVALPIPPGPVWPFAVGIGAALALCGAWIVKTTRVVIVPPPPPRPADLVAAEALARLRLRLPRAPEEVERFVVDVSAVLRRYFEGRFGLRAPELTTEEFLAAAADRDDAVAARRSTLERFLSVCDLVKFARHRPATDEAVGLLDVAEQLVEETRDPAHADTVPTTDTSDAGGERPAPADHDFVEAR